MEQFSQIKNNRINVLEEIKNRIGIDKDTDSFKKLSEDELVSILEKLKNLENSKVVDYKVSKQDLDKVNSGDLEFTNNLLKNVQHKVDTIQLFSIVNGVLKPYKDLNKLPKNFTEENKQQLFESFTELKSILSKNNKRWGHTYHLNNAYLEIQKFIDDKIHQIQLNDAIVSVDNSYYQIILNEYISGGYINPVYLNYTSIKSFVTDIQGLVFDFIVLVNRYVMNHKSEIDFISANSHLRYKSISQELLSSIISSAYNSMLFEDNQSVNDFLNINLDSDRNYDVDSLLDYFSGQINSKKIKHNIWSLRINSVVKMVEFISSTTPVFNLKLRNIIKNYCTITKEILVKIDKVKSNPHLYKNIYPC